MIDEQTPVSPMWTQKKGPAIAIWTLSYRFGPFSRFRFHRLDADGYSEGVKWVRGIHPPEIDPPA